MGLIRTRVTSIAAYLSERVRYGTPEVSGAIRGDLLFLLDGVGGLQFSPLLARRALRQVDSPVATILFDWQYGLRGEIWTDLMWLRRNRVMGARLARRILSFRRAHPQTRIHVLAFSGGAGIAVFAGERLRGRPVIDTLILACPALSPSYDLSAALKCVVRCYAWISSRDRWVLGLGTRVFGTTDRCFGPSAGLLGFQIPKGLPDEEARVYERLREVHWSSALGAEGHYGGHTAWAAVGFLRAHLLSMLRGQPILPTHEVGRFPLQR